MKGLTAGWCPVKLLQNYTFMMAIEESEWKFSIAMPECLTVYSATNKNQMTLWHCGSGFGRVAAFSLLNKIYMASFEIATKKGVG